MEFIFIVVFILFVVLLYVAGKTVDLVVQRGPLRDNTELKVERELERVLSRRGYIVFGDLIIPSISKSIKSTQIDHVVISLYGVFCLETKAHQGNIYGGLKSRNWKQYLGRSKYDLYNPIKQNKHHVNSLEHLLRSRLKAPIHSYVVFPYARNIKVDGHKKDFSIGHTIDRILNHDRIVYTPEDVEAMAKGLALVSSHADNYRDDHIDAVKEFVSSRRK